MLFFEVPDPCKGIHRDYFPCFLGRIRSGFRLMLLHLWLRARFVTFMHGCQTSRAFLLFSSSLGIFYACFGVV